MDQNPQASKPKWAVGSFLQQAVAGVESRLDHILADPEDLPEKSAVAAKLKQDEAASNLQPTTSTQKLAAGGCM